MRSRSVLRIVAPSLAVSLLLLVLGGFSGWYVYQQQEQAAQLLGDSVARTRNAEEIVAACREIRFRLGQFSSSGDQQFLEGIEPLLGGLPERLALGGKLANSNDERVPLKQIETGYTQVQDKLNTLSAGSEAARQSQASHLAYGLVTDLMVRPAEAYLEASTTGIERSRRRSQAMAGRVALGFLLLGVCGAVAGLVAGYAIARGVRHTLFRLHVPIRTAAGKLEEVIGPIDVVEPTDLQDLDSTLEHLAQRVAMVVDRLQESQLELLRAEQLAALGQMAAGLAHELRNPLTSIKILVQTAAEAGDDARLDGQDVAVLAEELARLEDSIQRFLDFARPPTLEKRPFDVRDLIQRIFNLVAARAAQQHVSLQSDIPETPVEIWADREQIRQLLLNTVLNALDAVGHGGEIRLTLFSDGQATDNTEAAKSDEDIQWATVVVRDNGPGISAEIADRLFEPFISTKDTGLGLGLAICRRIAEAHRGEIQARNVNDGGAEFTIRLPLGTATKSLEK
jgi:two-component system sensor histidine kinase HydH